MRYLFVSDIHGSYESAQIIIDKFNKHNCDFIYLLGDILYHGPRNDLPEHYNPKKVVEILNEYAENIIAIKGNCDAEVDQMVLDFEFYEHYVMGVELIDYLLTHGHHLNEVILDDEKVIIYGHTHIIEKYQKDGRTYINLGSITLPKQNTKRCYGILEGKRFAIYDIDDNLLLEHVEK